MRKIHALEIAAAALLLIAIGAAVAPHFSKAQESWTQRGPQGEIIVGFGQPEDAAYAPDADLLAVATRYAVHLWDLKGNLNFPAKSLHLPKWSHEGRVCISSSGHTLAHYKPYQEISVWDVPKDELKWQRPEPQLLAMALAPVASEIAIVNASRTAFRQGSGGWLYEFSYELRRFGVENGDLLSIHPLWKGARTPNPRNLYTDAAAYSPDGKSIAVTYEGNIAIVEFEKDEIRQVLTGRMGYEAIAFESETGKILAIEQNRSRSVFLIRVDLETSEMENLATLPRQLQNRTGISVSGPGDIYTVQVGDKAKNVNDIILSDPTTKEVKAQFHQYSSVFQNAFFLSKADLIGCLTKQGLEVWNWRRNHRIASVAVDGVYDYQPLAVSGNRVLLSDSRFLNDIPFRKPAPSLKVIDLFTGECEEPSFEQVDTRFKVDCFREPQFLIRVPAQPHNNSALCAYRYPELNKPTINSIPIKQHLYEAFDLQGNILAVLPADSRTREIHVYDLKTGTLKQRLALPSEVKAYRRVKEGDSKRWSDEPESTSSERMSLEHLRVSPNGRSVLALFQQTYSDEEKTEQYLSGDLFVWRLGAEKNPSILKHGEPILESAFVADGKFAVTAGAKTLKLWNTETREVEFSCRAEDQFRGLLRLEDPRYLMIGDGENGTLWDFSEVKKPRVRSLSLTSSLASLPDFSADVKFMLTCYFGDGVARVFDVETGWEEFRPAPPQQ